MPSLKKHFRTKHNIEVNYLQFQSILSSLFLEVTTQSNTYSNKCNITRKDTATLPTCTNISHPKKSRTVFTKKQIQELENVFYQKRYLTIKDREELSRRLTLTESQVTISHDTFISFRSKSPFAEKRGK